MTKHRMFGAPNLRQSKKKFTQPLFVMVETFRISECALGNILRSIVFIVKYTQ